MKVILSILSVLLLFASCRKDSFSCSKNAVSGIYYSAETNQGINVSNEYDKPNILWVAMPDIPGYGFMHLYADLHMTGCTFTIKSFYDNYGESASGPHYWMRGEGIGSFEKDKVLLDYYVEVTSDDEVLLDVHYVSTLRKIK